jgi:hypothetical protein
MLSVVPCPFEFDLLYVMSLSMNLIIMQLFCIYWVQLRDNETFSLNWGVELGFTGRLLVLLSLAGIVNEMDFVANPHSGT